MNPSARFDLGILQPINNIKDFAILNVLHELYHMAKWPFEKDKGDPAKTAEINRTIIRACFQ